MSALFDYILARQPEAVFDVELSEDDVDLFRVRGFIQIPRITTDEELAWLGELYDALFAERRGGYKGGYFDLTRPYDAEGEDLLPQIIMPEIRFPQLRSTAFWRNGRALSRRLLGIGESEVRGWGHMIRKPARIGEALPWHQDEAYWDPSFDYVALGCWMPLDNATLESGCMKMIPGSHISDVLPHRHINDDPSVHGLFTEPPEADTARAVALPTPAGGAVLHNCRMLHCSLPNVSENPRRAYANEWQTQPVKREIPYERQWVDDGQAAFEQRSL
jgi:hypothetical protein